jgi:hypothetical protein
VKPIQLILSLLLLPIMAAAVELLDFQGTVLDEQTVELRWLVDRVDNLAAFEIERSTDNEHFSPVSAPIPASSSLEYFLLDQPGVQAASNRGQQIDMDQTYYYRLYYILDDQSRVSASPQSVEVSFVMNTVSVTWGSIKAMFR